MSPTVHALRNEIRLAVGRFERVDPVGFTKEDLAAICEALGYDTGPGRPSTARMRAGILWKLGELDSDDPGAAPSSLRKAQVAAIAQALREE